MPSPATKRNTNSIAMFGEAAQIAVDSAKVSIEANIDFERPMRSVRKPNDSPPITQATISAQVKMPDQKAVAECPSELDGSKSSRAGNAFGEPVKRDPEFFPKRTRYR